MADSQTDTMAEIDAMKTVAEALSPLGGEARIRVISWAAAHFGLPPGVSQRMVGATGQGRTLEGNGNATFQSDAGIQFADLADLYSAASPNTDADRALVAGYWFQFSQGEGDFTGQAVNSALKNMGHGVSNITSAFDTLKARRPAVVMQVRKSGTTKQARKKYRLTTEGKKAVEMMLGQG